MKDNKENLNNELNDDDLESVAGGALSDWTPDQQKQFMEYQKRTQGSVAAFATTKGLMSKYSPKELLKKHQAMGKVPADLEKILNS